MGQFLSMSGVSGASEEAVVRTLRAFAESAGGFMAEAELGIDDDGCVVVSEGVGGVTVLYPHDFLAWDDVSQHLSRELGKPVFSFHIHDGDLWMYVFFDEGESVDRFNPLPEYWGELDEGEQESWKGNAAEVAKRIPGLVPDRIARYLVLWSDDVLEAAEPGKAYPADRFRYGEDWQLTDFMEKLGLDFPVDDRGEPHGTTYRFQCEPGSAM
jgi:hypothetical protein